MSDTTQTPWWSTMFSGLALDLLRRMTSPQQTEAEAAFIQTQLDLAPGAAIADVPCGEGRLAVELAGRGYDVTGLDIAPELLEDAQTRARERDVPLHTVQGDMQQLEWENRFDGMYCFGNSFAYFDDGGNRRFLEGVYRALKPGGRFVLQTNLIAESILLHASSQNWYEFGDLLLLHSTSYDWKAGQSRSYYRFVREGVVEEKEAIYRIYLFRELVQMLTEVGFSSIQDFGDLSGKPFALGDRGLYLVGVKAG